MARMPSVALTATKEAAASAAASVNPHRPSLTAWAVLRCVAGVQRDKELDTKTLRLRVLRAGE
jgi:hypothetical protein